MVGNAMTDNVSPMKQHVSILGILYIVFGCLGILGALAFLALFGGIAGIVGLVAHEEPDAAVAVPILGGIAARSMTGDEERAFADFFDAVGGVETVAREYEFHTLLGRITRFLRVVGDARINSGKQDLVDFLEWAHRRTGLACATVYYAVFPAHQALGPGYATTYAIIGESIRRIQGEALRRGKSLPDFNAYATSIGWPPRSVFEKRLDAWARA